MNKNIYNLKERISKLSEEVETLSSLGVEGMLLGELENNLKTLRDTSKQLTINILELEELEITEHNNLESFKEEY